MKNWETSHFAFEVDVCAQHVLLILYIYTFFKISRMRRDLVPVKGEHVLAEIMARACCTNAVKPPHPRSLTSPLQAAVAYAQRLQIRICSACRE